jgi:isopenicillin-N N-acyltransferase-like protein
VDAVPPANAGANAGVSSTCGERRRMPATFTHLTFSGAPAVRGHAYGEALRERIRATYALYADSLFSGTALTTHDLSDRAGRVRQLIDAFAPDYVAELDAVAAGSALPAWQIYTLNARTEILNAPIPECTAAYFAATATLGQNWDWVAALEELAVLVTWELDNGRKLLVLTEPGMLGKIGFNDAGIGVCLNILFSAHELDGIPVHLLTRMVLDCATLEEARALMERSGLGKSSHLLVADADGACCSMEFAAGERFEVGLDDGVLLHTNHCLAPAATNKAARIPTTVERLDQATAHVADTTRRDTHAMKAMLLDDSRGVCSINMAHHPEPLLDNQPVGTCATIIMELPARRMQIKCGPGAADTFTILSL